MILEMEDSLAVRDFPYPYWEIVPWLIKKHDLRHGAELGVLRGRTLLGILERCPKIQMIGVDAWKDLPGGFDYAAVLGSGFNHEDNYRFVMRHLEPYQDRVRVIRDTTANAAHQVENDSLDIIYVDAGHDYDNVLADIKNWLPKLKAGGWMTGDDYNWRGVEQAVTESLNASVWKNKFWYMQK